MRARSSSRSSARRVSCSCSLSNSRLRSSRAWRAACLLAEVDPLFPISVTLPSDETDKGCRVVNSYVRFGNGSDTVVDTRAWR